MASLVRNHEDISNLNSNSRFLSHKRQQQYSVTNTSQNMLLEQQKKK